jgi:hypothetical protein
MRFSLTSLVRPLVYLVVVVSAVAIAVGRNEPQSLPLRYPAKVRYQAVNGMLFKRAGGTPIFLDREDGTLRRFRLPQGDSLDYASCSPWWDQQNEFQVVGRWTRRTELGIKGYCDDVGLARYGFPSFRVIDRIALDMVPIGSLCWYPGTEERILFAAGDGRLYHFRFSDSGPDAPHDETGKGWPQPLLWKATPPGEGNVYLADPVWPADRGWNRRILVSLSYQTRKSGRSVQKESQIWWLQLDNAGQAIEAAGRLTTEDPEPKADDRTSPLIERLPSLATTPDGGLALAYLSRRKDRRHWSLRVAPVEIDAGTGSPRLPALSVPSIAESCLPAAPPFSTDGRWVYGLVDTGRSEPRLLRFSVVETLAALRAPRLAGRIRRESRARSWLNAAEVLVQLSGHFACRSVIVREAGRHGSSHSVPVAADAVDGGSGGRPALDDRSADPGRRDARGG